MPIPPILEIYVVWHPSDRDGRWVADTLLEHFRGTTFAGLIGGAVDVYVRSEGWTRSNDAPRPLPFVTPLPHHQPTARFTAVVPIVDAGLSLAVNESPESKWRDYIARMMIESAKNPRSVGVFPFERRARAASKTRLDTLLDGTAHLPPCTRDEPGKLCRALAQEITLAVDDVSGRELQVFISHTKRTSPLEPEDDIVHLVTAVRHRIEDTPRLRAWIDEMNIPPGSRFAEVIPAQAASSAMLIIRSDRYAGRDWCQREIVAAKRANVPVVTLYAVATRDERGSFLADHVPSIPLPRDNKDKWDHAIDAAINQLVDESLKRALWNRQSEHLERAGFAWLPANAPEPLTLAPHLKALLSDATEGQQVLVMHPDPPLGPAELAVLDELSILAGGDPKRLDVLTPRTFASRGGRLSS